MNFYFLIKKYFRIKNHRYFLTALFFFSITIYAQDNRENIDSLEALLKKPSVTDNELYLAYKGLSNAYLHTDNNKSLEYARMGVHLALKKNNTYQIAGFYRSLGDVYYFSNHLDSTLYYYGQSLEMLKDAEKEEASNKKDIESLHLSLLKNIGVTNAIYGKYDLALDNFLKALDIAEKNNKSDETMELYLDLASAYTRMSNFRQGEAYYLKGEKLSREMNDSISLADAYQGLCSIYINKNDYTQALKYGEESWRILSALPDIPAYQMMFAARVLTDVWLKIPDYDKALEYAQKTVEYARQTAVSFNLASALYMLSSCYLKQAKYKESEKIAFEALATDTTDIYTNYILYDNIAQANIWLGNAPKGIAYFGKTLDAIRAYSNKNFQSSISEMEVKHETEKKEFQIAALQKEKQMMTKLVIAGGVVLLLALTAFFLLWRWTVQKRRVSEKQKQLAEQQLKQLEQEKQLVATQAVLDGETRERARLARDLHDGLGSILTGIKLNLLELKKGVRLEYADLEHYDNALGLLDRSVQEMRRVAHHLMPDSLSRFGLKPAVSDFCSDLPSVLFAYYGDESRLDPNLEVMIYRSIHELVNNALKHSGSDKIMVQIIQEPNRISFTVQDDGCGFNPSAETEGTGLQNIRTRVASYNGTIYIDSRAGEGTEINVDIKIENYDKCSGC